MIKLDFLDTIPKISDTEEQLKELEKACNTHTFNTISISATLHLFSSLQSKIEKNRDISKLKEHSAHLAKISEIFRAHCEKPGIAVMSQDRQIHEWAKAIDNQELWFQHGKTPPVVKREGIEQEHFLFYQKQIEATLSEEDDLSSYSLSKLLSVENALKKILQEIPSSDQELQQLWWRKYVRLLPALQKRSVECGDSISTLTFESEREASSIFNLMNLGSLDLSNEALSKNSFLTLSLMIKALEAALASGEVAEEEQAAVQQLLNSYKAGYRLARIQERQVAKAQTAGTVEAVLSAKETMKEEILKELKERGEIVLSTGYRTREKGHEIALRLTLEPDGSVSGLVINRGEGVEIHGGECIQGLRDRVTPFLELGRVPLEELEESPFLGLLTELSFLAIPGEKPSTAYQIQDFYSVVETWPGKAPELPMEQAVRGAQRGGTCTLKAYLTPLSHLLSPGLARYMKLKLRLETLQLYIFHGNPTAASLPALEWTLKKIHRELKKLEKQTEKTSSEGFKKQVQKEAHFCALLTERLKKGMETLQEQQRHELEAMRKGISFDVVDREEPIALTSSSLSSISTETTDTPLAPPPIPLSFKDPKEFIEFTKKLEDYRAETGFNFLPPSFFDALPLSSDQTFWCSKELLDESFLDIFMSTFLNLDASKETNFPGGTAHFAIGITNALVGFLHALNAAETFNKKGIQDRSSRLLGLLLSILPQLRAGDPFSEKKLKVSLEELRKLCKDTPTAFQLTASDKSSTYFIEYVPLKTAAEKQGDIIWQNLEQRGWPEERDSISQFLIKLPYLALPYLRSPHELFGFEPVKAEFPSERTHLRLNSIEFKPLQKDLYESGGSVLSHSLFPFSEDEERLVQQLLDNRLSFQGEFRQTQNQQVIRRQKSVRFGKTELSSKEVEGLLSITTDERTIIPQCLHFFSPKRFFFRLQDPRFQALLHGFLLTNDTSGSSVLSQAMQDPLLSKSVVDFLQEGLAEASRQKWPETELFFLLLLSHAYSYASAEDTQMQALLGLRDTISQLQKREMSPFEKNRLDHWLVALSPFVVYGKAKDQNLIKICREACERLDKAFAPYDFDGRLVIKTYFSTGVRLFSKGNTSPLPPWVLDHPDYTSVCKDKEPQVEPLSEKMFQITTHQGEVYRLSLKGSLKISRDIVNAAGVKESFSYAPKRPFERAVFTEGVHWWQSEKDPEEFVALSTQDQQPCCRIVKGAILHPTEPNLVLASSQAEKQPLMKRLSLLDPNKVLMWKNKSTHRIEKIEIPHYEIAFNRHVNDKGAVEWRSPRYPGFVLDPQAIVSELEPAAHYFVLQKGKERRVFFPNQQLQAQKATLTDTPVSRMRAESPRLFSLPLTQEGALVPPKDPETLLYLSYAALRLHKYREALPWVDRLSRVPSYWGEKEKAVVAALFAKGAQEDSSPYASALRLRLRLIANSSGSAYAPHEWEFLIKDYLVYLDHLNSVGEQWLSPGEERLLLKFLFMRGMTSPLLTLRSKALNFSDSIPLSAFASLPSERRPQSLLQEKNRVQPLTPLDIRTFFTLEIVHQMIEGVKKPFPIGLLLRPGAPFVKNFLYFYKLAYDQEPATDLQVLLTLLKLAENGQDRGVETFRVILLQVIEADAEMRKDLPSPDALLKKFEAISSPGSFKNSQISSLLPWKKLLDQWSSAAQRRNRTQPFNTSGLKPKQGVIPLTSSTVIPITPTTPPKKEGALQAKTVRPLEVLLERGLLSEKEIDNEQEIHRLKELEALYPKESRSRLVEGLHERLEVLRGKRKKEQVLPIALDETPATRRKLGELEDLLAQQINESSDEVAILEQELLELAHRRSAKLQGEVDADLIQPLNLRQLLLHFARGDEKAILKSNPELAPHLQELKELMTDYAVAKTTLQHFVRAQRQLAIAIETAQEAGWAAEATQHAAKSFVACLIQERAYEPSEHPKMLLFEAIGDVRLRHDQYKALLMLSSRDESYELEARTGFGKSKVLIPLWLFLNQEKERLTVMATTRTLLPDQLLHLRELLGEELEIAVQTIDFDRQKIADIRYFDFVLNQIETAKKEGRILLVDINSLQGMTHLALKQALFQSGPVEALLEIRKQLTDAFVFIDESTECLGIRKRFDYASGTPAATTPEHCKEALSFYDQVVFSPEVLSACRLEFLPGQRTDKPAITEENYETETRPFLIQAALRYLRVPKEAHKAVTAHFAGEETAEAEKYFNTLSPRAKKRYAYCYKQIAVHLKRSLARRCGERYDCNDKRLAIPYQEGMPRPSSEFANREDLINFTIQANLKRPFELANVHAFVQVCQKAAQTFNPLTLKRDPCHAVFLELQKALGLPPVKDLKEAHEQIILDYLNSTRGHRDRLSLIAAFILPNVSTIPYKIPGNVYTVLAPLRKVHAASGTVAPETLPPQMQSLQQKSALTENVLSLWKNSEHAILTLPTKDGKTFLKELLEKRPKDRVLIDIGGILRDLSQEEIVRLLLAGTKESDPPVQGIAFYNQERQCMIWERGASAPIPRESSTLPKENVYTYIRQAHVVGSDTPMTPTAQGTATVSRETGETLFLQGIGRMRGLQSGQIENLVISEEDAQVIRRKLKLKEGTQIELRHLLVYVEQLEAKQKQKDYFFALQAYLKILLEQQLWEKTHPESLSSSFKGMQEFLVEKTETDLTSQLFDKLQELPAKEAVKKMVDQFLGEVKKRIEANKELYADTLNLEELESEFYKFVNWKELGETVSSTQTEEETSETEAETTQESETNVETEQSVSTVSDKTASEPQPWDGDYRALMTDKKRIVLGLFLFNSPNLSPRESVLQEERNKPAYQYILKVEESGTSLLAMDLYDMIQASRYMKAAKGEKESGYQLISADGAVLGTEGSVEETLLMSQDERIRMGIVTKLLAGDSSFSEAENSWLETHLPKMPPEEIQSFVQLVDHCAKIWPYQKQIQEYLSEILAGSLGA